MERDETWSAFLVPNSFDEFCKKSIPAINLKAEIDRNVHDSFRVIRKLLEMSYYEYQFYDVAALKAMLTFEMAAKIRYKEINGTYWDKSLKQLIGWFHTRHYFEVYNDTFLNNYRDFRNSLAHPINNNFAGSLKRQWILYTVDLINAMYEDPQRRYYRKQLLATVNRKLKKISANGCIVKNGEQEYICFSVVLVFINNKLSPQELYVYFKPVFEIPDNFMNEKKLYDSPTYLAIGNAIRIYPESIVIQSEHEEVTVKAIETVNAKEEYLKWRKLYQSYCHVTAEHMNWNSCINHYFEQHLREFHSS